MILTIDIGIRNLSMCILEKNEIKLWENINLLNDEKYCNSLTKKGKICNKKCSRKLNQEYFCKVHFPKDIIFNKKLHFFKIKNINSILLQDLAYIILNSMNNIYLEHKDLFDKIEKIFIELQVKINQKMKMTSHLIFGKLVELMKNQNIPIRFLSARKKLNFLSKEEKNTYSKRKKQSIIHTLKFLELFENNIFWKEKFNLNKKKDDLADCFLMNCYINKFQIK